ncbi:MAG: hypothetical protein HKM92_13230, partial [Arenibacter sp.]|nr:hypothetical protein [Arenibacter sp.]
MIKHFFSLIFCLSCISFVHSQKNGPSSNIVVTSKKNKTGVSARKNGKLLVNVTPQDVDYHK